MSGANNSLVNLSKDLFMYPTIALYLGGSGIQCGKHFMKMRESLPEDKQKLLEYFFIDSEKPAIGDYTVSRHYFYTNLFELRSNAYKPFWDERFPENLGVNPVYDSRDGCGVTRIFGAASLANNIDNFGALLDGAQSRIAGYRKDGQRLQIFITASACGGTGAGMLLDAAALVRHRFRGKGDPPIYLFLLGPDVFLKDPSKKITDDNRSRMQASAYALLKELHHFAAGSPFKSSYRLRDERIEVSNSTESDRLFDWVYYINGESSQAIDGTSKNVEYVSWMIAESQFHLCTSQIAQRIKQILPNQREEKRKNFPDNFTHFDHADRLDGQRREILSLQSRKAFLASFSTKTVCFPKEEIAEWMRQSWIVEALEAIEIRDNATFEEFDKILGINAYEKKAGLLDEWRLTDKAIKSVIAGIVERELDGVPEINDEMSPDAILNNSFPILHSIEELIEGLLNSGHQLLPDYDMLQAPQALAGTVDNVGGDGSEIENGTSEALAEFVDTQPDTGWTDVRFMNIIVVNTALRELCWDTTQGKGLKWVDSFLDYLVNEQGGYLVQQAQKRVPKPDLLALRSILDKHRGEIDSLEAERKNQTGNLPKKVLWTLKYAINVLREDGKLPYSEDFLADVEDLPETIIRIKQETQKYLTDYIYAELRDAIYKEAIEVLARYRDNIILKTIPKIENALQSARQQENYYRKLLQSLSVEKQDRYTTVHLVQDRILESLKKKVTYRFSVTREVIFPLLTPGGISFGTKRLNIKTLLQDDITDEVILDLLSRHITEKTETTLGFLKSGWALEEFQQLMNSCAKELDDGSHPMIDFDQQGVGAPIQGWIIKPEKMPLPKPFGQHIDEMGTIAGQDPDRISVVSFVYGVPPNSLNQMHEMFREYMRRIGDHKPAADSSRYPLHAFKEAHVKCDEPYSPSQLNFSLDELDLLLEIARKLELLERDEEGKEKLILNIRECEASAEALKTNWNCVIELSERILYQSKLSDDSSLDEQIRAISSLEQLFMARHNRRAGAQS